MTNPDSIVGLISGRSMSTLAANSIVQLFHEEPRFGISWLLGIGLYVPHNRFVVAENFMLSNRSWLLFVDSDIVFQPNDVRALYAQANGQPGVYGSVYASEDGNFACGMFDEDDEGTYRPLGALPDRPVRGVVGMGLTLIHRDVFTVTGASSFKPYGKSISEDVAFCSRARDAGFTPWIVPASQPGHFKSLVLYSDGRKVSPVTGGELK